MNENNIKDNEYDYAIVNASRFIILANLIIVFWINIFE